MRMHGFFMHLNSTIIPSRRTKSHICSLSLTLFFQSRSIPFLNQTPAKKSFKSLISPSASSFRGQERKNMADFVQSANVKSSVRTLTTKIVDVAMLNTRVLGVIDTNAFQCGPQCRRRNSSRCQP